MQFPAFIQPTQMQHQSGYLLMLLLAIVCTASLWRRFSKRDGSGWIYVGALLGAFSGAKLGYLLAEGWLFWDAPNCWEILLTGKTMLGALLGGYVGVEFAKWALDRTESTGDAFAVVAPLGLVLGRVGCFLHGCCLGRVCEPAWFTITDARGQDRWPTPFVEIAFQIIAICIVLLLRQRRILPGQHFHLFLIGYGVFRFAHEFMRDTPRILGPFSGYHFLALLVAGFGAVAFRARARQKV